MFERSFFERLVNPDEFNNLTAHVDPDKVARSVLRHLKQMLNTRAGSAATLPDYGLPDFNDLVLRFPDAILELRRAIKLCAEKYEPRLTNVKVDYLPDEENPLGLRFEITAQLVIDGERAGIWFETTLNSAGKVAVRR